MEIQTVVSSKPQTKTQGRKTITHRPSAAATPSKLFSNPLRESVDPSLLSLLLLFDDELLLLLDDVGTPVDELSRETERVKAASKSSRRRIHLDGTCPIKVVRVLSDILQSTVISPQL
jgi:hypothetical protein